MLKALAWMLIGALLAGGGFFFWQRKNIEKGDTPEAIRVRAERLDPVELERKIAAYKQAIEKRSAELEQLTAPIRNADYQEIAAEQTAAAKAKIEECRLAIERLRKNLSAYEEALRTKLNRQE
ncbi:MAG: hypothetical protein IJZ19_16220 [Lentisphaeria bacterium]|nr:hypothetical protein [Lentisphaeria bacterium]MBQ8756570.1 hypothetical protein [Lentisphaeria bacterium]